MQPHSPVCSTLELHKNKSLTVFSCDVVRLGGGPCFRRLGFVWCFREGRSDVSSGLSQPGGKS